MSKIDKALRVASRKRKKYARGGDVDDFDPSEGGQIPKSLQFFMKTPPATWTTAPPRQRYADGGDVDSEGLAPENYQQLGKVGSGILNAGIHTATLLPRYIKSTVDAAKTQPGSEEAHQAYGDVGDTTGELAMSMIGPRGRAGGASFASAPGHFNGPTKIPINDSGANEGIIEELYKSGKLKEPGAATTKSAPLKEFMDYVSSLGPDFKPKAPSVSSVPNYADMPTKQLQDHWHFLVENKNKSTNIEAYNKTLNDIEQALAAKPKEPISHLDFEPMFNGTYEVFDPVSGKTLHTVKTKAEAEKLVGRESASPKTDFKEDADKIAQYFRGDAGAIQDKYRRFVSDPREMYRHIGGYDTPAYRGLRLRDEGLSKGPNPYHDYEDMDRMYSTANPDLADMYAGYLSHHPGREVAPDSFGEGATVAPFYINTKDYHYHDAKGKEWTEANHDAIMAARARSKPGVIVDNVWDEPHSTKNLASPNKVFITFPSGASTVKSRFATKFDPDSGDMMRARIMGTNPTIDNGQEKAGGGGVGGFNPERGEAIGLAHQGAIKSSVPGRTDKLQLNVLGGSSVVPADVVSGLGQGNTDAGHSVLDSMFKKGPYGMNLPKAKAGSRVGSRHSSLSFSSKFAGGGETPTTPIVAAGGEHILSPDQVAAVGNGDLDLGHSILNAFYEHVRKKTIGQMRKLKPPKNS